MEEEQSNNGKSSSSSSGSGRATGNLESGKAEKSVWLMKCPLVVAKSWQSHSSSDPYPVAKVILSIDPLNPDPISSRQFTMEMAGTETGILSKSYSLNMSKDLVPMSVFSENRQGRVLAVEGKVERQFDMKPHSETIEEYGKMCSERTNNSIIKNRQIQVIDVGVHTRPMPGMINLLG